MLSHYKKKYIALIIPTLLAALQSCGGGGDSLPPGVNGTYLHISTPDFYFGTADVGTESIQTIQIANRGADRYPLRSLAIQNIEDTELREDCEISPEEYATDVLDDVVLEPAEAITVGIKFRPITAGRKCAEFVVAYDTIRMVDESVNQNEQSYYQGKARERAADYVAASNLYNEYIAGNPVTVNKRRAAIKLPVVKEAGLYSQGQDIDLYLRAMDLRESGDYSAAITELEVVQNLYGNDYFADDALYLKGYIHLMDEKNYEAALRTMRQLQQRYPDSTYYDTALYSEAIALQETGKPLEAREILLDLKYRHTGVNTLGLTLPKDNVISRLWFERANQALGELTNV